MRIIKTFENFKSKYGSLLSFGNPDDDRAKKTILMINKENLNELEHLSEYINLKELYCNGNNLKSLPELPKKLIFLGCEYNDLTTLPELPNTLENLICHDNKLKVLPELPKGLKELNCVNNNLNYLPDLPKRLKYLNCSNNDLTVLPELPSSLIYFYCDGNDNLKTHVDMRKYKY